MSTVVKDPGTFFQYMMGFVGQDTPKGDLARDMKHEAERSRFREVEEISTLEDFVRYLEWNDACRECIATARKCWRDYMRAVRKWENETGKKAPSSGRNRTGGWGNMMNGGKDEGDFRTFLSKSLPGNTEE